MDYNTIRIFFYCVAAMIGVWLMHLSMRARKTLFCFRNKNNSKEENR